jgi:T-complex protein 1 subunit beta
MNEGTIGSMRQLGITESYKLKRQVVLSASEAAEMILRYAICRIILTDRRIDMKRRVDDILRATPRRREAV